MKRTITIIALLIGSMAIKPPRTYAQIPVVDLVTGIIKKVIKAIDLQIQQQQNKVIWLQNAQKQLENTMSKLKLDDISQWTEKQRKLYDDYFQELKKVKNILATYNEVKTMVQRQKQLINEYNSAWGLLKNDKHFSPQELQSMYGVYSGIMDESLKNIEQLELVVTSFSTQMSDGARLELIHRCGSGLDKNISALRSFNDRNARVSISRAQDEKEAQDLKQLYGVQ